MSLLLDEHRRYLSDHARLAAFDRAIQATVRPGDVVIDLGCGSGMLGMLACRAGARRVYAIDDSGMIEVARQTARQNGFADRIVHVHAHSTRTELPELADVVIGDQIGRLGFEAGVVECYADARRRLLRPGARLLPRATTTWVAPVEDADGYTRVDFWRGRPMGFDFSHVRQGAANTGYPTTFEPRQQLAPGQPIVRYSLVPEPGATVTFVAGQAAFEIARPGLLHGLAGWFVADLAPGVTMTNAPGAVDRIARRNAFLPFDQPVRVEPGDRVDVALSVRPMEIVLVWRVSVTRGSECLATFHQSTLLGMLIGREDLQRAVADA